MARKQQPVIDAPSKPFVLRIYEGQGLHIARSKVWTKASDLPALQDDFAQAVAAAQKETKKDGLPRRIVVELVLMQSHIEGKAVKPSWNLKRLFMAEIDNEEKGGVNPATLGSALESVQSGYNPDPADKIDMKKVGKELEEMIRRYGPDQEIECFVTDDDWNKRAGK